MRLSRRELDWLFLCCGKGLCWSETFLIAILVMGGGVGVVEVFDGASGWYSHRPTTP